MSYGPSISHYRRAHAPRRLYLPPQLTITSMHKGFILQGGKCSYDLYRMEIHSKNISFAALDQEECEVCLYYKEHTCSKKDDSNHAGTTDDVIPECDICMGHENHVMRAKETRKAYQIYSSKVNNHDEAYISVDLQKVVMLPRLPGVKSVAFTKRIIVYNETFAPLGEKRNCPGKNTIPFAITWHEAEGGRSSQEDKLYIYKIH